MAALEKVPWRSVRANKCKWTEEVVATAAQEIHDGLPAKVRSLVLGGHFKNGVVIAVADEIGWAITEKDLRAHHMFIKPIIKRFPAEVPSVFFCIDVLIYLHNLLGGNLLVPDPTAQDPPKLVELATAEAGKLKKMIGALRALYRHSTRGKCELVTQMKSMLAKSPTRAKGVAAPTKVAAPTPIGA